MGEKTDLLLSGGPATDGEVVVVGSSNGELLALQAADGKELWRASLSSEVLAAPAIAGGLVLVRTVDGKLSALDMVNGKPVWFVQESVPRLSVRGTSAPVINGKQVICGFDNGKLTTYALADGSAGWDVLLDPPVGRNEIERLADINATVRTIGEDLYVVGYRGQLTAVAAESGQTLWSQDIQSYEGLAVDMDKVYVSDSLSEVVALARQTGTQLWKYELLKYRDISAPAAYQNSLVVGDFEGYVHFLMRPRARPRPGYERAEHGFLPHRWWSIRCSMCKRTVATSRPSSSSPSRVFRHAARCCPGWPAKCRQVHAF